ncbi:MAG TPA: twin-arginine translocase TatA/TatE family subunit [Gemmatimonadales bacterium]|nr:twin-arginine translocase TatA/TatE family subunit [Gemmatimonadales bacterium]
MLGNLSGGELLILLLIVLLVFGANRLPEAGKAVGKGLREFQRALGEARDAVEREPGPSGKEPPAPSTPKRLID